MTTLLTRVGLEVVARLDDLDFEPELLPARMNQSSSAVAPLLGLSGRALAAAARIARRCDTATYLARQRVWRDHAS